MRDEGLIINRVRAQPNRWTFQIKPIAKLVYKYVGDGKGWVDPFAGMYSPAEFTNDINPEMPAKVHLPAEDFVKQLDGIYEGIIFDPPYSYEQISRAYKGMGLTVTPLETSDNFYSRVKNPICNKIKDGGIAISFGWNSNGFGKRRGFHIIEILLVAHGGGHYDTIVTVERKIQASLFLADSIEEQG